MNAALRRYVRLEMLEGVSAWYAGDRALAAQRLQSAREKWRQLQVSDDALASLAGMGFHTREVMEPAALLADLQLQQLRHARSTEVVFANDCGSAS